MKKEKILSLIIILTIFLNLGIVYGEDVDGLKEKEKEVKTKLEKTKDQLEDKESQLSQAEKEIEKLDSEIDDAIKEIEDVENRISKIKNDIEVTEEELEEAQANIDGKNETLNDRLRVMYKNGNVSYLEVLLGAESFTDLLSRLDLVQRIVDQDVDLLKYMQEQRDVIEDKKEELETNKKLLDHQQGKAKNQKEKLQLANRSKQNKIEELKNEYSELEKKEDQLNKEANNIINEIQNLQNSTKEYVGGVYKWPVPGHNKISSPFGNRVHPITGSIKFHTGIDISYGGQYGTTVVAANSGKVIFSGWKSGYGNVVMIDHGGQMVTLYAHNQSLSVNVGQNVSSGQVIARGGSTGNSTGPHLHFEVRKNGKYMNPLSYLK